MAGLRGNNAWWMFQKQTARGTPGTVANSTTVKTPFSAGAMAPSREIGVLAETDANRDQGVSFVKKTEAKGNPECYVRDQSVAALLLYALGTDGITESTVTEPEGAILAGKLSEIAEVTTFVGVSIGAQIEGLTITAGTYVTSINEVEKTITLSQAASGVAAKGKFKIKNFEHKLTPANLLPYITVWSQLGETLYEKHTDCFVSDLEFKATAGNPITAQATILGRSSERLTTDPSGTVPLQNGTVYNYNQGEVILAGGVTALVSSMSLNIQNNVTVQQTDSVVPYDVAVGKRTVSCTFDLILENLKEYNKFMYGGEAGTTISSSLYSTSLTYKYELTPKNVIEFKIPSFAYEEFPVSPEVQGAPIVVAVKGVAQRNPAGVIEAIVKNQRATY